jgi:phage baseplate assembly protein gpV
MRTFQVMVRGEFVDLPDQQRERLRAELAQHDLYQSKFTEGGNLTYDEALRAFTVRCLVRTEDEDAAEAGELRARELLDAAGLTYHRLRVSATCLDDVKVRRPPRTKQ